MKILYTFIILFFGFSSVNAQKTVLEQSLIPGEAFSYGDKEIKFIKVVKDSRCPKNVTCIWAGEAVILVEISENGILVKEKEVVLPAAGRSLPLLIFEGSSLLVQNLLPYPQTGSNVKDREYSLELQLHPE